MQSLVVLAAVLAAAAAGPAHLDAPVVTAAAQSVAEQLARVGDAPPSWQPRIAAGNMLWTDLPLLVLSTNQPEIGNGFLATQVYSQDIWVAGVYNGVAQSGTPSHRARVPSTISVGAPGFPAATALDVLQATYFSRSFIDPPAAGAPACTAALNASCTATGARTWVEQRLYAHRLLPSALVMEVQLIQADDAPKRHAAAGPGGQGAGVQKGAKLRSSHASAPLAYLQLINFPGAPSADINFTAVTKGVPPSAPYTVTAGWTQQSESNSTADLVAVAVVTSRFPTNGLLAVYDYATTYAFVTTIRTSLETPGGFDAVVAAAQADFRIAAAWAAEGSLHARHVAEWAETVWGSGVEVGGRIDVARAANTSLYAIMSSVRSDVLYGIAPGGLTDGYNGHVFWDQETWMYPSLLFSAPDVAAAMLQYRRLRLDTAEQKAIGLGFQGAMWPWESAFTGADVCPTWANGWRDEIHISGDIPFALWQFWEATKDLSWLNATAWPILSATADFWVSRTTSGADGFLHINAVMCPDEYADPVDDSIYTNAVARLTLQYATAAAELLGVSASPTWTTTASALFFNFNKTIPAGFPAAPGGWHPEYAGYGNSSALPVVKQADVILLGYPLGLTSGEGALSTLTPEARQNDLIIYANQTDPGGPAMTWGAFLINSLDAAGPGQAQQPGLFNRSFANAQPPFDVWSETPTGGTPNFLTGAGGFLQTVFFGWPGMRLNDTGLSFSPALPPDATNVTLRSMAFLGNRFTLFYNASIAVITLEAPVNSTAPAVNSTSEGAAAMRLTGISTRYAAIPSVPEDASQPEASAEALSSSLLPATLQRLDQRSQRGRVVLWPTCADARVLAATPLEVQIEGSSAPATPLVPGVPVAVPLPQRFFIGPAA